MIIQSPGWRSPYELVAVKSPHAGERVLLLQTLESTTGSGKITTASVDLFIERLDRVWRARKRKFFSSLAYDSRYLGARWFAFS